MPGVRTCRFTLPETGGETLQYIPVCGEPLHFEALFCLTGYLAVQPAQGNPYAVEAPGIFLLSNSSRLGSCLASGDLSGVLVAVDAVAARESLQSVCATLGLRLDTRGVREKMAARSGCAALHGTPWTQAFFETLQRLPEDVWERYCVFKSVELLYLFCTEAHQLDGIHGGADGYVPSGVREVKAYMEEHLAEKITLPLLCRRFSMSPTSLKEGFRRAYGTPVHSWLVRQRVKRAGELLRTTRLPIQKIAQAVGYEGMSQFNAVFKRYYGMTPGQYRKMSETATTRPF